MLARVLTSWRKMLGLGQGKAQTAEEERRVFGRVPCDVETTCQPTNRERGQSWPARVRNVSRGGACLRLGRSFQLGELLSISLPRTTEESAAEVLACVVRCDEAESGTWEVGCTFAAPLSEGDLRRFDTFGAKGGVEDQRHWPRYPCKAEAVYQVVCSGDPAGSASGEVMNISGGGIALQVTAPLRVGELLSVELRREGSAIFTALASVVRTTVERDGRRIVGCNFIHEVPEAQLARLLG